MRLRSLLAATLVALAGGEVAKPSQLPIVARWRDLRSEAEERFDRWRTNLPSPPQLQLPPLPQLWPRARQGGEAARKLMHRSISSLDEAVAKAKPFWKAPKHKGAAK